MFTDEFKKYILIGVSIILIGLIIFGSKSGMAGITKNTSYKAIKPVQKVVSISGEWLSDVFKAVTSIGSKDKKIKKLESEIQSLKLANNIYSGYKAQNDELKQLLDLKNQDIFNGMVAASIIATDPNSTFKVLVIDKGSNDGIRKDMIVIHPDGLVGRILEVGDNFSKVIAITDDRMTIGASIDRTGEKVVVNGNNVSVKNHCKIDNLKVDSDVLEDDEVVTSNVSMLYVEGLKIGKIKNSKLSNDGLTKSADIVTAVNIDKIRYVYVIKNKEMMEEKIEEVFNEFDNIISY